MFSNHQFRLRLDKSHLSGPNPKWDVGEIFQAYKAVFCTSCTQRIKWSHSHIPIAVYREWFLWKVQREWPLILQDLSLYQAHFPHTHTASSHSGARRNMTQNSELVEMRKHSYISQFLPGREQIKTSRVVREECGTVAPPRIFFKLNVQHRRSLPDESLSSAKDLCHRRLISDTRMTPGSRLIPRLKLHTSAFA